ncbi:hypothetical protein AB6A40_003966 [Gnathostoma spinigerum]|uniref:ABC1 atypical kinase-like domain-containing protein n=1 Tax=Gnathostoma spinigerum TaxID=75299 RepID=A0ABD6EL06_9BILA
MLNGVRCLCRINSNSLYAAVSRRTFIRISGGLSFSNLKKNRLFGYGLYGVILGYYSTRRISLHSEGDGTVEESDVPNVLQSPWLVSSDLPSLSGRQNTQGAFVILHTVAQRVWWTFRVIVRVISLLLRFSPLLVTYPFTCLSEDLTDLWWLLFIYTIRHSGPTLIKLGQWSSTRRDIFSKQFCDKMSVLHTRTTVEPWHRSVWAISELFKDTDWKEFITSIRSDPIGSGCIAQVYKAKIDLNSLRQHTGISVPHESANSSLDVAIKVISHNVYEQINLDLSILRCFFGFAQYIISDLCYINPLSCLNQFEVVLKRQIDLCHEAEALKRFACNFDERKTKVRFPRVLCYSQNAIIETYEEGVNMGEFLRGDECVSNSKNDRIRKQIALIGARALLKMIFVDNFVHGDLHPGNILVRFEEGPNHAIYGYNTDSDRSSLSLFFGRVFEFLGLKHEPRIRIVNEEHGEVSPSIIIFDTGIAVEETPKCLRNLKNLFRAIIDKKGYDAGQLLLSQAPQQRCDDPTQFCREVEDLVSLARSQNNLKSLNISLLLGELFSTVCRHRVSLDTSFSTVILAVMVLEGLGRSLDPELDIFECARPFVFDAMKA